MEKTRQMNLTGAIKNFIPLLFLFVSFNAFGQPYYSPRTKAVLVQIRSEHNRMQAMYQAKDYKQLQIVRTEAKAVAMAMINDFKYNFKYCPVYFYMDTNLQYIKERKFEGVLFNADGEIVTNPVISSSDTDYLVVFFGKPASQARSIKKVTDSAKYRVGMGEPFGRGLVILNYKLEQVNYLYKLWGDDLVFQRKRPKRKKPKLQQYYYYSKKYDMEYFPFAEKLSRRLADKGGNPTFWDRR